MCQKFTIYYIFLDWFKEYFWKLEAYGNNLK